MGERQFEVLNGNVRLAACMSLEDALLFINAIFDKYYMERSLCLSIREMVLVSETEEEIEDDD